MQAVNTAMVSESAKAIAMHILPILTLLIPVIYNLLVIKYLFLLIKIIQFNGVKLKRGMPLLRENARDYLGYRLKPYAELVFGSRIASIFWLNKLLYR
jgi:hypothetical protein